MNDSYADILNTVVENGRVQAHDDGSFVTESLRVEVEFEAMERGLSTSEIAEAIEYALDHSDHQASGGPACE